MSMCNWSVSGGHGVCVRMRMIASKERRKGKQNGRRMGRWRMQRTMWCRKKPQTVSAGRRWKLLV